MSSGNPYGLAEISHFGSFQRVGGKAGGFISKKFFHPSSFRNQEKLWKAQTADEREKRKQLEMEKRREEERQVEELRKQMYLSGQGKATDMLSASASGDDRRKLAGTERFEQRQAFEEQKRRMAQVKQQRADAAERAERADGEAGGSDDEEGEEDAAADEGDVDIATLAKSRYPEDVHPLRHNAVWGSWFDLDLSKWGFACCKSMARQEPCPLVPEDPAEEAKAKPSREGPRARRRRRNAGGADAAEEAPAEQGGVVNGSSGATSSSAAASSTGSGDNVVAKESLIDPKFFEAAERRKQKRLMEEEVRREAKKNKTSGYLADLLADASDGKDPSAGNGAAAANDASAGS